MASGSDVKFKLQIKLSLILLKPLKNLGEVKSRFMASVRDVKFTEQINLSLINLSSTKDVASIASKTWGSTFDQVVANHMQDLSMQGYDGERRGGGGGGGSNCCGSCI